MDRRHRRAPLAAGLLVGLAACGPPAPRPAGAERDVPVDQPSVELEGKAMKITIGGRTFSATLGDSPAEARLRAMLPLTLEMAELNGNEKHARLPEPLPTAAIDPGAITEGDLMLWGDETMVLFYRGFRTTYRYTRLGRIDDPEGLANAVGSGRTTVTFDRD